MSVAHSFHPGKLIRVWEEGFGQSSSNRSAALITLYQEAFNEPQRPVDQLSIERKAQLLMEIRKLLFGRKFYSLASCPECNEMVEWQMNYADFASHFPEGGYNEELTFQSDGYTLQYHLPRENDLAGERKIDILNNCIINISRGKKKIHTDEMPETIFEKLEEEMETKSPLSTSMINLTCPECAHVWTVHFSVFEFLWTELDQWARRLLHDISTLATNYGWSEQELLNMNPVRRSYYLSILSA